MVLILIVSYNQFQTWNFKLIVPLSRLVLFLGLAMNVSWINNIQYEQMPRGIFISNKITTAFYFPKPFVFTTMQWNREKDPSLDGTYWWLGQKVTEITVKISVVISQSGIHINACHQWNISINSQLQHLYVNNYLEGFERPLLRRHQLHILTENLVFFFILGFYTQTSLHSCYVWDSSKISSMT